MNNYVAHYKQSDGLPQTLIEHLEETSALASAFAGKIGLSSIGELIGLLHDIGKYSDDFQNYLKSAVGKLNLDDDEYVDAKGNKGKIDHSSAGSQHIWEALRNRDFPLNLAGQLMSLCIASHHTGLINCLSPDGIDAFNRRMTKPKEKTHVDEVRKKIEETLRSRADELLSSSAIHNELLQRLKVLFDGEQSRSIREFKLGLLARFLFSALIDADRLNTADFENISAAHERYNGAYPEWATLIEKFEKHIAGFKVRNGVDEIRSEVSSACLNFATRERGLYLLTVPTGGGKTLASLRFALHHAKHKQMDRIIYVVPFTTIIDQNAGEVRSILETSKEHATGTAKQIVLEHHSNLTPEKDTWQSKLLAENWDAPIVFTTTVQFLETLFAAGTRGVRRMHQLANAIIIFDEIQVIPIKTVHLFNNAINFIVGQCGATVVFCTATQPLLNEVNKSKGAVKLSADHEMMPNTKSLFMDLHRVEVLDERKDVGWTEDEVANAVQQEMDRAGSVLIIVNTKAQAKEVYKRCRRMAEHVYHLSTSMCPAHRMEVLDEIKARLDVGNSYPLICVSTQLIEAGVDVDFGSVIRYMAGLHSIAQAAGRCNRNGLRSTGRVLVINPTNENLDKLSEVREAKKIAERVLEEFNKNKSAFDNDLISPAAMAQYYRYHFFDRAHLMAYPVFSKDIGRDDTLFSLLSVNELSVSAYSRQNNKNVPPLHLRQSFKTASEAFKVIDAPTEGVIVPYGKEGKRIIAELSAASRFEKKYALLKKAQCYSVNVFPRDITKLREMHRLQESQPGSGILCLDSRHYSDEFGASVEQVGQMDTLIG